MPIDDLAGEAVGAAVELVGEAVLDVVGDRPKRSRFRRFLSWTVVVLLVGSVLGVGYLALG